MDSLKEKITREIHQFDILPLLTLLAWMGYQPDQMEVFGHLQLCSQPSLIQEIEFIDSGPVPRVRIFVNFGLLSIQTPLPSYFLRQTEDLDLNVDKLREFVGFFDYQIMKQFIRGIYPEINPDVFPSWPNAKKLFIRALNLRACSTLHWLFSLVFPELLVQVEKAILSRSLKFDQIELGKSTLDGTALFGNRTSVPVHGRRVTLISEEEQTNRNIPWPKEIRKRIESLIFPMLRTVGIDLEIILIVKLQRSWARLQPRSFLGYDAMKGDRPQPRRIPIYLGYLAD